MAQAADAGQQAVGAAPRVDERRQPRELDVLAIGGRNGERAAAVGLRPDDRLARAADPGGRDPLVDPDALDELPLRLDVPAQEEADEPALLLVGPRRVERRAVGHVA